MWIDPIVEETRALREAFFKQYGNDAKAMLKDTLKRQAEAGDAQNLVSFPPRRPDAQSKAA